jgi:serine/threonine protein kinase
MNLTKLIVDTCTGLQFGHEKGLLHLDMKEDNVLLFKKGKLLEFKIADLGGSFLIENQAAL